MFSNEIVNIETLSSLVFLTFFCLISFLLLPCVCTRHALLFFPYAVHSTSRKKEKTLLLQGSSCTYVCDSVPTLIPSIQGRLLEWLMILSFNNIRPLARLLPRASLLNLFLAFHPTCSIYAIFLFPFFILEATSDPPGYGNPPRKKEKKSPDYSCAPKCVPTLAQWSLRSLRLEGKQMPDGNLDQYSRGYAGSCRSR